jgi:putative phage-type endonuclease
MEQRTPEWYAARAGRMTASCFVDVIAVTKAGTPTAARSKYMRSLAFERLAGMPTKGPSAKSLEWGTEAEEYAGPAYEVETGNVITPAGFVLHPTYDFIGGSPDGLVSTDGIVEIKCPHDETVHVQTLLEGMPAEHMPQVQGNLLVTGRQWADFISYDPRQSERFRLFVQRVPRDDAYCKNLLAALLQFEAELKHMLATIEQKAA